MRRLWRCRWRRHYEEDEDSNCDDGAGGHARGAGGAAGQLGVPDGGGAEIGGEIARGPGTRPDAEAGATGGGDGLAAGYDGGGRGDRRGIHAAVSEQARGTGGPRDRGRQLRRISRTEERR